jgi:tetratricopeptide (TPR) repeat protein
MHLNDSFEVVTQAMAYDGMISQIFREFTTIVRTLIETPELPSRGSFLRQTLEILRSFDSANHQPRVLSLIFGELAQAADFPEKQSLEQLLLKTIRDLKPGCRHSALRKVAETLVLQGKNEQARQSLEEALGDACFIDRPVDKALALLELGEAFGQLGEAEKGVKALEQSWRALDDIKQERGRSRAFLNVGKALAHWGKNEQAIRVFELGSEAAHLEDRGEQLEVFLNLGQAFVQLGEQEKALNAFLQAYGTESTVDAPDEQKRWRQKIGTALAEAEDLAFAPFFLGKASLSGESVSDVIQKWRETVLQKSPNPLTTLRESFRLFPFDRTLAQHGVCMFQIAHINRKNWEHCQMIHELMQTFGFC